MTNTVTLSTWLGMGAAATVAADAGDEACDVDGVVRQVVVRDVAD